MKKLFFLALIITSQMMLNGMDLPSNSEDTNCSFEKYCELTEDIQKNKGLESVDLKNFKLGNQDVINIIDFLNAIKEHPSLKSIDLRNNNLESASEHLIGVLFNSIKNFKAVTLGGKTNTSFLELLQNHKETINHHMKIDTK